MSLWDMLSFVSVFFQVSYRSIRFLLVLHSYSAFYPWNSSVVTVDLFGGSGRVALERILGGPLPEYALQEKICLL